MLEIVVQSVREDTRVYLPVEVQQSDVFKQSRDLNKRRELVVWIISALVGDRLSAWVDRALCALDDARSIHLDEPLTDDEEPLPENRKVGYCSSLRA